MTSLFELLQSLMQKEEYQKIIKTKSDNTAIADDFNLPKLMEDHANEIRPN